jgi:hypothetical protein
MGVAKFETTNALRELDQPTPEYLRQEVWAHGNTKTVRVARGILQSGLDPGARTSRTLRSLLRVIPESKGQNAG